MQGTDRTQTRDPAEIEREIRETQRDMSRTVDQIEGQLTPRNILNALLDKADENGIDARYVLDGARRNPLALGMIAIGGLWLVSDSDAKPSSLMPQGKGSKTSDAHSDFHRGYVEHMCGCERQPSEDDLAYRRRRDLHRANYLMIEQRQDEDESSFRGRLDKATDAMREQRDSLAERAQEMGGGAQATARGMVHKVERAYHDNPLVGGIAAALVGAIAGSAAPITRTEEEQFGKMGAQALDTAESKAREKKDELVDRADRTMRDEGSQDRGSTSADNRERAHEFDHA